MTWSNVQKNARINISNSNRTATRNGTGASGSWMAGRSASGSTRGKLYWEITLDVVNLPASTPMVGVVTASYVGFADGNYIGPDLESIGAHFGNVAYANGAPNAFGPIGTEAVGRTYGILVDRKSNTIQFALVDLDPENPAWGVWLGLPSGIAYTETIYPAYALAGLTDQITANWGADPFIIKHMPEGSESIDGTRFWYDTLVDTYDFADFLEPPKPPGPAVRLLNSDGTPTKPYHDFLTKQYEWERTLRSILKGE